MNSYKISKNDYPINVFRTGSYNIKVNILNNTGGKIR